MTNKLPEELLIELGVAGRPTRVIATSALEAEKVGHGLAGGAVSALELSDHFVRTGIPPGSLPFDVTRHQFEPAVLRVEGLVGRVQMTAGNVAHRADDVLLDLRAGKSAGVLVDTAEGQMLIHAGPGGVTVSVVGDEGTFGAWEAWQSLPDTLSVVAPSLAELTGGHFCEPWLQARYQALSSVQHPVAQLAAPGVVVRLWMPRPAERASAPDPSSVVAKWVRALPLRELEATERLAVERAGVLRQELDGLPDDGELSSQDVIRLAYERDVLECMVTVLWLAGRGRELGSEANATDDAAVTSLSNLPISEELEADPLLRAVSISEPDAWWGHLASG
jgi:hypothetical protein